MDNNANECYHLLLEHTNLGYIALIRETIIRLYAAKGGVFFC